jgi:pimeloyl-ACP methyl ester carboxylesterase
MTVVLVHGNPETAAIWDPLVERLRVNGNDEPVRLSPPGFGAPAPAGWEATAGEYRDWLTGELEAIGHPVHLVGHGWGGVHALTVAMTRPDLLRSWCSDAAGVFDPDYVWHDLAKIWMKPGAGEEDVARQLATPLPERAAMLASLGVRPAAVAEAVAAGFDTTMGECVLRLHRSATHQVLDELGNSLGFAAARPGLAVLPTGDHFVGTETMRRRSAARAGAEIAVLDGLGHWWLTEDPDRSAAVLVDFWDACSSATTLIPRASRWTASWRPRARSPSWKQPCGGERA